MMRFKDKFLLYQRNQAIEAQMRKERCIHLPKFIVKVPMYDECLTNISFYYECSNCGTIERD